MLRAAVMLCLALLPSACAGLSSVTSYDPGRLSPISSGATERSVSSNRMGAPTVLTIDEIVTCASRRQDMAGPPNCLWLEKEVKGRFPPSALRHCSHHIDATGVLIFEDRRCVLQAVSEEGASVENVDVSDDTAFFDRHMTKAVKQVMEAEVAGLQAHQPEMLRHAELALDHAKEAQREENVSELVTGIDELREALRHGQARESEDILGHIRQARVALSSAAGMNPDDTVPAQEDVGR